MNNLRRITTPNGAPLQHLNLPSICDQCHTARSTGKHQRCSKQRQAQNSHKWEGRP
jgi:hypothetical protein